MVEIHFFGLVPISDIDYAYGRVFQLFVGWVSPEHGGRPKMKQQATRKKFIFMRSARMGYD